MKRPTEAWRSAQLFSNGLGTVVITRFKGTGDAELGVFLVDLYCLGVKNATFGRFYAAEYPEKLQFLFGAEEAPVAMAPAEARALVEGAVAYAQRLGFAPHPDYQLGQRVFGGIDPKASTATFTYGKDGKPFYIQGPDDSPEFVQAVMDCLERQCGKGNFGYLAMAEEPS